MGLTVATLGTTRLVAFLAALASVELAAWAGIIARHRFPEPPAWLLVARIALALPYLAALVGVLWLRPRLAGLATLAAGATGATTLGLVALGAGWRSGPAMALAIGISHLMLFPIPVLGGLLAQAQLLRAGLALWRAQASGRWRGATIGFAALAVFAGLLLLRTTREERDLARPPVAALPPPSAGQIAEGSLNLTLPCLARHANEHGEYPETLAAIGPGGSRCVPEQYSAEQLRGYEVIYEPRGRAPNGPRDGFSLRYEPVDRRERGYALLQTDETGLVYRGVDADGRPRNPREGQASTLGMMTGSVQYFLLLGGTGSYPRTLQETTPRRSIDCFTQHQLAPEREDPARFGRRDGYRFQYTPGPADPAGRILSYRFDARPVVYDRPYRRSYMCDSSGGFHATDEDRPAEVSDPNPNFDAALKEELPGPCSSLEKVGREHARFANRR